MNDLSLAWRADIAAVGGLLADRSLSAVELTDTMLERIAAIDPTVQAFVTVLDRSAREQAAAADAEIASGGYRGPLHGIPIAIKDIYNTAGVETTCCSQVRRGHVPDSDATVVRKLKEAGAVVLGKVSTHEFAFGFDSEPTRNPWNPDHIPSGSSGGSGAALAAGLCFAATGSDTGGSIRAPAAANGVVGIKPTYGRVSKHGVAALSWSLDHAGPMARTPRDLAILLTIMAGHDPLDTDSKHVAVEDYCAALTGDVRGLRMGVPSGYFTDDVTPAVGEAFAAATAHFGELGATLVPVNVDFLDPALDAMMAIAMAEAAAYHRDAMARTPHLFGAETRSLLDAGTLMSASTYLNAQRVRAAIKDCFRQALRDVDVLLTPTQPRTAMKVGQTVTHIGSREESVFEVSARFCAPFNLSGLPAVSVPCGWCPDGLPIGLQIVGKPFDEAIVLRVADAHQNTTPFRHRYPALAN
ncbi:amidase (plasmid) [Mycolicibacterium arabiense]|uniref:Amidase n=2 Tax=Mycolicibacterium arabiense TaxID=1286181 RepID=A0A7I7RQW7_9MYCO|nr:amidase [Mycolicibacterium arabiense]